MGYRNLSIGNIYNICDEEIEEAFKGNNLLKQIERKILLIGAVIDMTSESIEQTVENSILKNP